MTDKDNEKIQMFDDDSKAFKLLYNELKDVKNVIVKDVGKAIVGDIKQTDDYLLQLFAKADNKIKTYLHFTNEDLTANNENLRKQIQKVEEVGFKNQVVLPFEGMDQKTIEERYAELRRAGVFTKDSVNTKEEKSRAAEIEAKYRKEDKAQLAKADLDDERNIKGNRKETNNSKSRR